MSGVRKLNSVGICWIANMRNLDLALARGNVHEMDIWFKAVREDDHHGGTANWTHKQCVFIEKNGWDAWLTTIHAVEGYDKT